MEGVLQTINAAVWGLPLLLFILGIGIYLTVRTGFSQITLFPQAIKGFFGEKGSKAHASNRKALFTALAATVGTGNLAGVAGAICIGGPGAVFWMWICGVIGMITKFAEATLAVRYRRKLQNGEYVGGPMYMILQGMPPRSHWLAYVYSFFGVIAAFGVGNATQINAAVSSIRLVLESANIPAGIGTSLVLGCLFAILIFGGLWSGAGSIGRITEKLIPFAAVSYLFLGCGVLVFYPDRILPAFQRILEGAISPAAVTGGVVGSSFIALRTGASRGVFTNEAGMGTAGIAHACAEVTHPVQQGLMGLVEVFIDTILICTMTALVILCSGVGIPYGTDPGIYLTGAAFAKVYGSWTTVLMAAMVCCFALATVFGWSLYGGRCAQFLFGNKCWRTFVLLQAAMVVVSSVMQTGTAWILAEIVNGLMAIPNLIALGWLSPELLRMCREYKSQLKKRRRLR